MNQLIVCVFLLVAACSDHRPPSPTAEQNQQLNEADAMLNAIDANETESNSTDASNGAVR